MKGSRGGGGECPRPMTVKQMPTVCTQSAAKPAPFIPGDIRTFTLIAALFNRVFHEAIPLAFVVAMVCDFLTG